MPRRPCSRSVAWRTGSTASNGLWSTWVNEFNTKPNGIVAVNSAIASIGQTIALSANLTNGQTSAGVAGEDLDFYVDGSYVGSATTDGSPATWRPPANKKRWKGRTNTGNILDHLRRKHRAQLEADLLEEAESKPRIQPTLALSLSTMLVRPYCGGSKDHTERVDVVLRAIISCKLPPSLLSNPEMETMFRVLDPRLSLAEQVYRALIRKLNRQVPTPHLERDRYSAEVQRGVSNLVLCGLDIGPPSWHEHGGGELVGEADNGQFSAAELSKTSRVERGRRSIVGHRDECSPHAEAAGADADGAERVAQHDILDGLCLGLGHDDVGAEDECRSDRLLHTVPFRLLSLARFAENDRRLNYSSVPFGGLSMQPTGPGRRQLPFGYYTR